MFDYIMFKNSESFKTIFVFLSQGFYGISYYCYSKIQVHSQAKFCKTNNINFANEEILRENESRML
jgi:hypothetical protein